MTTELPIVTRLRATWPIIEAGPLTSTQRDIVHEAATLIEEMAEALEMLIIQREGHFSTDVAWDKARAALTKVASNG